MTGVMMLKIQLCITGINYILKCINIKNSYFKFCNNISQYYSFYCIFDEMNTVLVIIKDFFHKSKIFTAYKF